MEVMGSAHILSRWAVLRSEEKCALEAILGTSHTFEDAIGHHMQS